MACYCHCYWGLQLKQSQEGQQAAAPPTAWLQDAKTCLLNDSSPGSCFPSAFQAHPQETPPQSREWSLCMLWGACYCAACFKAAGIPVHRKTSLSVPLDASWVSLKKVPTQVFSYKQKTTEEQLLWSSIIYTGWRWLLEIDFPPSYRVYKFFCFFRFPVRCSALYIVLIKHLLD